MSANQLGIIDPLEKYQYADRRRRTGYQWSLEHEIAPPSVAFVNHFNCTQQSLSASYKGSIFRFPFRRKPNELSTTCYNAIRVKELFKTFTLDAPHVLLFLKNVQRIDLCHRKKGVHENQTQFRISVNSQESNQGLKNRQAFKKRIYSKQWLSQPEKTVYQITIDINDIQDGVKEKHKYLISEYHSGGKTYLKMLAEHLSQRPLVGTAVELKPENGPAEPSGQIFCFLPLPKQTDSLSGLPVHVNGYFSVSQNRRHIDWPSEGKNITKDKSLKWNHALITELIPQCYTTLILKTIQLHKQGELKLSPSDIMLMMPDPNKVHGHWKILLTPLYKTLFDQEIIYSEVGGGTWIKPRNAILEDTNIITKAIKSTVNALLVQGGVKVVSLPSYLHLAIDTYIGNKQKPAMVTPVMVCQTLQRKPRLCDGLSRQMKLTILRYILSGQVENIDQIPLLPLADGTFGLFRKPKSSSVVYIIKDKLQSIILRGLENTLMDGNLDQELGQLLNHLADQGKSLSHTTCCGCSLKINIILF